MYELSQISCVSYDRGHSDSDFKLTNIKLFLGAVLASLEQGNFRTEHKLRQKGESEFKYRPLQETGFYNKAKKKKS